MSRFDPVVLPAFQAAPTVSVLILTQRDPEVLHECLMSLSHTRQAVSSEILLLFNGATTEVRDYVKRYVVNCRSFESEVNLGFAGGHNYLTTKALGRYLVLLNDDTVVEGGWLDTLVDTIDRRRKCGIVGSRILFMDGRLQEAGSIIWEGGNTSPVGRYDDPMRPEYLFERQIDYISFCSVLIRRDVWDDVGGLSEEYFPAYYEDVDFVLSARSLGYETWYQPASVTRHHESRATNPTFKRFLFERNHKTLLKRKGALLTEFPGAPSDDPSAIWWANERARGFPRHVLVIDDRIPDPSTGSGFSRAFETLVAIDGSGYAVSLSDRRSSRRPS